MWKRRKYADPGITTEGRKMFFAPLDQQRCSSEVDYHDTYSNYKLEIPERRQSRKGRVGTKLMRVRLLLPRVRIRIISPVHLFEKMRDSYWRLVLAHKKTDTAAVAPLYQYHHPMSYSSDAVAECIDFIKRSSTSVSHDTRFL